MYAFIFNRLEDNGVITVCKLNTYEFNETSEIEAMLNQYPLINQLILNVKKKKKKMEILSFKLIYY